MNVASTSGRAHPTHCAFSIAAAVLAIALGAEPVRADTYGYRDETGAFHIVSESSQIPPRFRDSARRLDGSAPTKKDASANPEGPGDPTAAPASEASGAALSAPAGGVSDEPKAAARPAPIVIRSDDSKSDQVVTDAVFDLITQRMVVDTGASMTNISVETAKRMGVGSRPVAFGVFQTASGEVVLPVVRARSVSVSSAQVENMPVVVNPFLDGPGLLGVDFLSEFNYAFDPVAQTLTLSALDTTPRPGFYGGHPEAWWRSRYASLSRTRDSMVRLRDLAKADLSGSAAHIIGTNGKRMEAREVLGALDDAITFWDEQIRHLKIRASEAGLAGRIH